MQAKARGSSHSPEISKEFIGRAIQAGAFGKTGYSDTMRYHSALGCGLGWAISPRYGLPCLAGLYSEASPSQFRKAFRLVLRRIAVELKGKGHKEVLASVDYDNPLFGRLIRFYTVYCKLSIAGEHEHGIALSGPVDLLEKF